MQANAATDENAKGFQNKYFQNPSGDQALGAMATITVIYPDQLIVFEPVAGGIPGDANGDGKVDIGDAINALRVVSGIK